jgi:hypothetical protein
MKDKNLISSRWKIIDFLHVYPEYSMCVVAGLMMVPNSHITTWFNDNGDLKKVELHLCDDYLVEEIKPVRK